MEKREIFSSTIWGRCIPISESLWVNQLNLSPLTSFSSHLYRSERISKIGFQGNNNVAEAM